MKRNARKRALQIMLVTSRGTGRWVMPKGNIPAKTPPHQAAAMEAEEEAGVTGRISKKALGTYTYRKYYEDGSYDLAEVEVFPLAIYEKMKAWKEDHERERKWFTPEEAVEAVNETDLGEIILAFARKVKREEKGG